MLLIDTLGACVCCDTQYDLKFARSATYVCSHVHISCSVSSGEQSMATVEKGGMGWRWISASYCIRVSLVASYLHTLWPAV